MVTTEIVFTPQDLFEQLLTPELRASAGAVDVELWDNSSDAGISLGEGDYIKIVIHPPEAKVNSVQCAAECKEAWSEWLHTESQEFPTDRFLNSVSDLIDSILEPEG